MHIVFITNIHNYIYFFCLQVRESSAKYLGEVLQTNYTTCKIVDPPNNELSCEDLEKASFELEYQAFSTNTAISLYRRSIAKMVSFSIFSSVPLLYHY